MFQEMIAYIDILEESTDSQAMQIGEAYKAFVKKHTHVDTGNLIGSYQVQPLGDGLVTVNTDVEYAYICEYNYGHYMFNKGMCDLINSGQIEQIIQTPLDAKVYFDLGTRNGYGTSTQGGIR